MECMTMEGIPVKLQSLSRFLSLLSRLLRLCHAFLTAPTATFELDGPDQQSLSCSIQDAAGAMLAKLQVASKQFDPWMYLGTAHIDTTRDQLVAGIPTLDGALEKRKDQLRQLVKENFQRFIGCKGTIDDISLRLRVCAILWPKAIDKTMAGNICALSATGD